MRPRDCGRYAALTGDSEYRGRPICTALVDPYAFPADAFKDLYTSPDSRSIIAAA